MNEYIRDRLMGRMDERSRSRYDSRQMRGRDRNYDYDERSDDYRRDRNYDYEERRDGRRGVAGSSRGNYRGGRQDRAYDDYDDYDQFEYNYDMHEKSLELDKKKIKEWEKDLKNEDGSTGPKFSKEQIMPVAQQVGIKFDKFNEDEFVLAVNMMYSDYCKALKDSAYPHYERPEVYVNLAKAWLCDKDFEGEPYEKLALYYYSIVEFDE